MTSNSSPPKRKKNEENRKQNVLPSFFIKTIKQERDEILRNPPENSSQKVERTRGIVFYGAL